MLRITKDFKYYGISNIIDLMNNMPMMKGFNVDTIGQKWGFYSNQCGDDIIKEIVENFDNICPCVDNTKDWDMPNEVMIRHSHHQGRLGTNSRRVSLDTYWICKYLIPQRNDDIGEYLMITLRLGGDRAEIEASIVSEMTGRSQLTRKWTSGTSIEFMTMEINEFKDLFRNIVKLNKTCTAPPDYEFQNILNRIDLSQNLGQPGEISMDELNYLDSLLLMGFDKDLVKSVTNSGFQVEFYDDLMKSMLKNYPKEVDNIIRDKNMPLVFNIGV